MVSSLVVGLPEEVGGGEVVVVVVGRVVVVLCEVAVVLSLEGVEFPRPQPGAASSSTTRRIQAVSHFAMTLPLSVPGGQAAQVAGGTPVRHTRNEEEQGPGAAAMKRAPWLRCAGPASEAFSTAGASARRGLGMA